MQEGVMSVEGSLLDVLANCRRAIDEIDVLVAQSDALSRANASDRQQVMDKFTAETALVLMIANRSPSVEARRMARECAGIIAPFCRSAANLEMLAFGPQYAVAAGMGHAMLDSMGLPDPDFDAIFRRALGSDHVFSTDRPNFRQLEIAWLRRLCGMPDDRMTELEAGSILHRPLHPIYMRREDGYAYTHAAMYVTDFGSLAVPPTIDSARCEQVIGQCMGWCLSTQDWDLLAEFALAALMLRLPQTALLNEVLCLIDGIYAAYGHFPSFWIRRMPDEPQALRMRELFEGYHTSYVYGLLCAARLAWMAGSFAVELPAGRAGGCHPAMLTEGVADPGLGANIRMIELVKANRLSEADSIFLGDRDAHPLLDETLEVAAHRLLQTYDVNRRIFGWKD
jgi:hypothetical protein